MEFVAVVSSILGLLIALTNYEMDLYRGSLTLGHLDYNDPSKNSKEALEKVISDRHADNVSRFLRWCNFLSCWITIGLLIARNILHIRWTNKYFRG